MSHNRFSHLTESVYLLLLWNRGETRRCNGGPNVWTQAQFPSKLLGTAADGSLGWRRDYRRTSVEKPLEVDGHSCFWWLNKRRVVYECVCVCGGRGRGAVEAKWNVISAYNSKHLLLWGGGEGHLSALAVGSQAGEWIARCHPMEHKPGRSWLGERWFLVEAHRHCYTWQPPLDAILWSWRKNECFTRGMLRLLSCDWIQRDVRFKSSTFLFPSARSALFTWQWRKRCNFMLNKRL